MRRSPAPRLGLALVLSGLSTALVAALSPLAVADPPDPGAGSPSANAAPGRYVVTLAQKPVATYDGGVSGLPATRPSSGRRVDVTSAASRRYRAYLSREQSRVAARVGARVDRRYSVTLNGFATSLSTDQARSLARTPGVVSVAKDTLRRTTDDKNPVDYLGLSGGNGLWSELGGPAQAGRGVVVGVIDSGIWPEVGSFSGAALGSAPSSTDRFRPYRSGDRVVMQKSDGSTFRGRCQTGEAFTASDCNTKVISAQYFGETFLAQNPGTDRTDFLSPRDGDGHGSHTASTAAGNDGVAASVDGRDQGRISGVAPGARISVYKAIWTAPDDEGGFTSDLVQAIDTAVGDGVDVLNYSIGSATESPVDDPVELAFLSAASAGVFVATSAGNEGPGPSTLDHPSPWLTTVAASTVAPYEGTVALGNGQEHLGVSTTVSGTVGPAPLAQSADVRTAAATAADAALCSPGTLDPARTTGKIIVCDRGVVDRVVKSAEVRRAGGIGVVLANVTENSLDADTHTLPTVHTNPPASTAIKAYAATSGATASLVPGNQTSTTTPYPQIAGFSSRGPSTSTRGDLLKPDLAAPGVAVLAAVAPPSNSGRSFDFYSGTSMAAPHVAGLAAIFFGAGVHPSWSPMLVKSALMTTARNTRTATGRAQADPFAQGAGEVRPRRMLDPALVYPSGDQDWLAYLEGVGVDTRSGVGARDASDVNAPSIAVGELLGEQTVTRRVTALEPGVYRARVSVPGIRATVTPSVLYFTRAGQTRNFTVRLQRTRAPLGEAATGFLTWSGAGTQVRSPIAVTPSALAAPDVVTGRGASGAVSYQVTPGVAGAFPIRGYGLAPGAAESGTVTRGEKDEYATTVAAGAKVAQFSVRPRNPGADLDLLVYQQTPAGRVLVGASASPAGDETVTLTAPEAGTYVTEVQGFSDAPGTTATSYAYRGGVVTGSSSEGSFAVTPTAATAVVRQPLTVRASWSGVDATRPYLGYVEYPDGSGTVVVVN